ncbi:MAG: tyrosine--tRNA ligase [Armatimonadetes bacterium]|nr:tyrosine--tRNA ligase [Armatimonadota bacterium]
MARVDDELRLFLEGTIQVESVPELRAKLERGKPLRIKLGCDPSAPDLHVGHGTVLRRLRRMQDAGHTIVFIVGDFTGMIGDPSGKSKTRPMLSEEQVKRNAQTYVDQVGLILDVSRCELRYNSEWFRELGAAGMLELASHYTLARMLEREDFASRVATNSPLSIRELLYPLVQGYDSVAIEADIEVGGTDQTFNLLVGRDIQRAYGLEPQVIMTYPLLVGLDGKEKMSKSLGNAVGITDEPNDMFGKLMSIPDGVPDGDGNLAHPFGVICHYYQALLEWPLARCEELERDLEAGRAHPRDAKASMARAIVAQYHSEAAAEEAAAEFDRVFAERQLPSDMPDVTIPADLVTDGRIDPVRLVRHCGFAATNGEARRLIDQGGVRVNDAVVGDLAAPVAVADGDILRVGKRRFARLRIGA